MFISLLVQRCIELGNLGLDESIEKRLRDHLVSLLTQHKTCHRKVAGVEIMLTQALYYECGHME